MEDGRQGQSVITKGGLEGVSRLATLEAHRRNSRATAVITSRHGSRRLSW